MYAQQSTLTHSIQAKPANLTNVPTISSELERTLQLVEELHQRLSALGARLNPVLNPAEDVGAGSPGVPTPVASPQLERVRSVNWQIEAASRRLGDIMARLEV